MKKSKIESLITKIQIAKNALKTIQLNDNESLAAIISPIKGSVRSVFGPSSPYIPAIDKIVFAPQSQIILQSGPNSYQGAWDLGLNKFNALLLEIEQQLIDDLAHGPFTEDKDVILDPNKTTIAWLQKHVPSKVWYSFFLSLTASFLAGVSIGYYMGYSHILEKVFKWF